MKQHTKWPGDITWGGGVEAAGGECRSAMGSSSTLHPYDSFHRCGDVFRCRCSFACLIGGASGRFEYCVLMCVRVYVYVCVRLGTNVQTKPLVAGA